MIRFVQRLVASFKAASEMRCNSCTVIGSMAKIKLLVYAEESINTSMMHC